MILDEANRIVAPGGAFVNQIDYFDHFAHMDSSISLINFLRYSGAQWTRYADNKFMYMNRLRHDDFLDPFRGAAHEILAVSPTRLPQLQSGIERNEIAIDKKFSGKGSDILATINAIFLTRKSIS